METPTPTPDPVSHQSVEERSAPLAILRPINLRLDLRVMAALGAGLIVLAAFLPWVDPAAQALVGDARLAPVIQGWPSLLIGLIALGVLALPHADSSRWVSLPVAALGLAAAIIAVVSALTAANVVAETIARFPSSDAGAVTVTGAGVIVTLAGGILCVAVGLSRPPAATMEARLDLRPGQPEFAALIAAFILVALAAGLIGASLASGRSSRSDETPAAFSTDLLSTPVIDAQITPLGVVGEPLLETPVPTLPAFPTEPPLQPTATLFPTNTQFPTPTRVFPSPGPSPTWTATATFGPSPLTPSATPTFTPTLTATATLTLTVLLTR